MSNKHFAQLFHIPLRDKKKKKKKNTRSNKLMKLLYTSSHDSNGSNKTIS